MVFSSLFIICIHSEIKKYLNIYFWRKPLNIYPSQCHLIAASQISAVHLVLLCSKGKLCVDLGRLLGFNLTTYMVNQVLGPVVTSRVFCHSPDIATLSQTNLRFVSATSNLANHLREMVELHRLPRPNGQVKLRFPPALAPPPAPAAIRPLPPQRTRAL